MKEKFSASMMCANYLNLELEIKELEKADIDYFHIDVMDGSFVHNFTMSGLEMKAINEISKVPMDVHLMVENPGKHIDDFAKYNPEIISVHLEADRHINSTLSKIKSYGIKAGVAINPGTPYKRLEEVLALTDVIMVMTVNPGFAGQKFIPSSIDKVRRLREWLDELGYQDILIEVDGNINPQTAKELKEVGADIFVLGTSGIFLGDMNYKDNLRKIKDTF